MIVYRIMLKIRSVQKRAVEPRRAKGSHATGRTISIVFLVLAAVTGAIVLPLVLIDDKDAAVVTTEPANTTEALNLATGPAVSAPRGESYEPLEHPLMMGLKIFVEDRAPCPIGSGVSVLFDHSECQSICDGLGGCIGYNFNDVSNLCTFYTSIRCLEHIVDDSLGSTFGYLRK